MTRELTADELRASLDYDASTGLFTWRHRAGDCGRARAFNTEYEGKVAGSVAHGYRVIRIRRVMYRAARLAWLHHHGQWPAGVVEHISTDRLDDRIENLRDVPHNSGRPKKKVRADSRTGIKGVGWNCVAQRWQALIKPPNAKLRHLGYYDTIEDAVDAYRRASEALHGP